MKKTKQLALSTLIILSFTILSGAQTPNEIEIKNSYIKLRLDLRNGGTISYLSDVNNNYNVVNIHDKGRYINQSYYAGQRINRISEGQHPTYSPWRWNPVQAGDVYRNRSKLISYRKSTTELYTKSRPLLWDMNNELCECYFETWVTLSGSAARVRTKLTIFRTDNRWNKSNAHQELPALYSRGDLYKLYTYKGSSPWTNAGLSRISHSGPPWTYWTTKERWAALVNNNNWGVGVYNPSSTYFIGGFTGSSGGGPNDNSTGYFSPLITRAFGNNETFQNEYYLILGTLNDIRKYVYNKRGIGPPPPPPPPPPPGGNTLTWEFNSANNTQGWIRGGGTSTISVNGGELKVAVSGIDPQIIRRNLSFNPRSYSYLRVGMKNFTNDRAMDLFWSNSAGGFSGTKRIRVNAALDRNRREYVFKLKSVSLWSNGGNINAIRIDPPGNGSPNGENVRIDYIRFTQN